MDPTPKSRPPPVSGNALSPMRSVPFQRYELGGTGNKVRASPSHGDEAGPLIVPVPLTATPPTTSNVPVADTPSVASRKLNIYIAALAAGANDTSATMAVANAARVEPCATATTPHRIFRNI